LKRNNLQDTSVYNPCLRYQAKNRFRYKTLPAFNQPQAQQISSQQQATSN